MTDIKRLLDEAGDVSPPHAFDIDAQMTRGHRAQRRRNAAIGGATTLGVALIAAALVAFPALRGPGGGVVAASSPSASASSEAPQPGGPVVLPVLDPDKHYTWDNEGPDPATAESAAYDRAMWDHMTAEHGWSGPERPFDRWITQFTEIDPATEKMGPPLVYTHTYKTAVNVKAGENGTLVPAASEQGDSLAVVVMPVGSFTDGTDMPSPTETPKGLPGVFDLLRCTDYTLGEGTRAQNVAVDCDEKTTPGGLRYIEATEHISRGSFQYAVRSIVLYRADGTAVIVSDTSDYHVNSIVPILSFGRLVDLALALPGAPVR
ncbi:hypothetical protein Afil01_58090 [Actinorhabdospora filicis]|uniref:Uncharacterized protein n=1 Tax=Actinorhabdospora filicis TaxID=1785913 RepID=A0A9W6SSG3_9ACTN|nr:hypothetical protein [Actinorhabdospora filicis]GLZ81002.1 hypothetical protein Afil01_58090 [Actinorhabdospora filicis]